MLISIFGIENDGLNLAANLLVLFLVVVWLALIVWTYLDARRRIEDPVLVACATAASLFPYIGTFVYSILRPPDFLSDARERELEIKAAELRVRQLSELSCTNCGYPVEKNYLRCPNCQRRLKDPCQSCGRPVDPRWALCPYCESALPGRQRAPAKAPEPRPRARARAAEGRTPEARPRKEPAAPRKEPPGQEKAATTALQRPAARRAQRSGSAPPGGDRSSAGSGAKPQRSSRGTRKATNPKADATPAEDAPTEAEQKR